MVLLTPSTQWYVHALTALGVSGGFVGFLYASHREDTRLFTGLFRQFNERYDRLNEELSRIAADDAAAELSTEDTNRLVDYFNLCAEEYLFYTAGYIDEQVWQSWARGMAYFANVGRIRRLWEDELRQGSYYGFTLKVIGLQLIDADGRVGEVSGRRRFAARAAEQRLGVVLQGEGLAGRVGLHLPATRARLGAGFEDRLEAGTAESEPPGTDLRRVRVDRLQASGAAPAHPAFGTFFWQSMQ